MWHRHAMTGEVDSIDAERAPAQTRRLTHIPALDGLRGVAVLLVVIHHGYGALLFMPNPLPGAFLGVDLFFVLSGFLITSLLLDEQHEHRKVRFGSFYARRALRLLPALYVLLAAHMLYTWAVHDSLSNEWLSARAAVFYYSNWAWKVDGLRGATGLGQMWSLAVEEQFYFVWPAVVVLLLGVRRHIAFVVAVLVAAIAAIAVNRADMFENGTSWLFLYMRTDTRADSLLVGALAAQLWVRRATPTRGLRVGAWIAVAILVLSVRNASVESRFMYLGGYTLVAACVAIVILAVADGRWIGRRALEFAPLRGVGRVSYGLYLWHLPVFTAVFRYGHQWSRPTRLVVGVAAAFACTLASWKLVEQPILRYRRRFSPHAATVLVDGSEVAGPPTEPTDPTDPTVALEPIEPEAEVEPVAPAQPLEPAGNRPLAMESTGIEPAADAPQVAT
jgi:peptidoglycan/LPS O-acetylase OafA/YrhL